MQHEFTYKVSFSTKEITHITKKFERTKPPHLNIGPHPINGINNIQLFL